MPTRYLKPGIRDSELIDQLSPLAECMFYRLIVTVDDFGRADARPAMVKAACYPIKADMTPGLCGELLHELEARGLLSIYEVDGKPYLQLWKWNNPPRAAKSKFPEPPHTCMQVHTSAGEARTDANEHQSTTAHTCMQVHTDARNPRTVLPVTETDNRNRNRNRKEASSKFDAAAMVLPDWLDRQAWADWVKDRAQRKKPITARAAELQIKQLAEYMDHGHLPEAVIAHSIAGGFQGLYPPKIIAAAAAGPAQARESFRERDDRLAKAKVDALIHGTAPSAFDANVIDVDAMPSPSLPLLGDTTP